MCSSAKVCISFIFNGVIIVRISCFQYSSTSYPVLFHQLSSTFPPVILRISSRSCRDFLKKLP